ncbi:CheR family methyltransferase [Hydrogenimonas sp.]
MIPWLKRKSSSDPKEDGCTLPNREPCFLPDEADTLLTRIRREYGLDYTKRKSVTYKKIERFARTHDIFSFRELDERIGREKTLEKELINLLTVCETYFFREKEQILYVADLIVKGRIESLLCAPCASGEEVYSILLAVSEKGPVPKNFRITGIDINTDALDSARKGCYSSHSVSNVPRHLLATHFTENTGKYRITKTFDPHIRFERRSVFDANISTLGTFGAVFCRNMMIYFTETEKRRALSRLTTLLEPAGLLFLGHADLFFTPEGYEKVHENRILFYRKLRI